MKSVPSKPDSFSLSWPSVSIAKNASDCGFECDDNWNKKKLVVNP